MFILLAAPAAPAAPGWSILRLFFFSFFRFIKLRQSLFVQSILSLILDIVLASQPELHQLFEPFFFRINNFFFSFTLVLTVL
jgi:hypothetical protein